MVAREECPGGSFKGAAHEHFLEALVDEYVLTGVGVEDEETPVDGVVVDPTEDRALGVGDTMGTPLPSGDPDLSLLIQSLYMILAKNSHIVSG